VLVAAHGNSLRALVKHLEGISDEDIAGWNIPTGVPYVLELDEALKPTSTRYLGDPADIERRIAEVAGQAEKKTT
jgi:2,3-bisphosphoglycerate-dependent phosphoglycerate mutase